MMQPTRQLAPSDLVLVELTGDWSSGTASVHCTVHFQAPSLEQALVMIRRATDGAPMFKNPEEVS